jgi:FKBP-type peptidyl-prolyl cis-trans isomerase FklB
VYFMTLSAPHRGRLLACTAALLLAAGPLAQAQEPQASTPAAPAPAKKAAAAKSDAAAKPSAKSAGSYSLGVSMGEQLRNTGVPADGVSVERLAAGVRDALSGKAKMGDADRVNIETLLKAAHEAAGETNHRAAAAFLAENGKKPGVVTTASGLQYKVINAGSGESPKVSDEVVVNYRGTLLDGTEFDSSYKRGQPANFPVGRVIPGWTEALQLMKPGAKYQLWIPPQLAYDLRSPGGAIPPGSMLIFDVELISIKPPAAAAPAAPAPPAPAPK